jgi:hypothetical protein
MPVVGFVSVRSADAVKPEGRSFFFVLCAPYRGAWKSPLHQSFAVADPLRQADDQQPSPILLICFASLPSRSLGATKRPISSHSTLEHFRHKDVNTVRSCAFRSELPPAKAQLKNKR